MKKNMKRILLGVLALLMVVSTLQLEAFAPPVKAVTQAEIDALKGDASGLKDEKSELQAQVNAIKKDKSKAIQTKNLLDQQISNTSAQIRNVETQIANYTALITQTEAELAEAEAKEAAQYELFCQRVRAMEE